MAIKHYKLTTTDHGNRNPRSGRGGSQDCRASSVVSKRNPCKVNKQHENNIRIGTWNVRSLFEAGKLDNAVSEMYNLRLDVLGISDVRWPGSGKCMTRNGMMYYSGNNEPGHRKGVGIIVDKNCQKAVCNVVPYSDRVMMLTLNTQLKRKINIIQIYAPTADKDENEIEAFYEQLDNVIKLTKRQDVTIIMGDFNAKVGEEEAADCVGRYGLGERNDRGDRLIEFCTNEELIIANTLFKLHKRRLYTWKSPADNSDKIVRNQIDYIIVNRRYRNSILSAKTYPGADISSDHNPVVAAMRIKLKKVKSPIVKKIMDPRRLKEDNTYTETKTKINESLRKISETPTETVNTDKRWEDIQNVMISIGKEKLQPLKEKRKPWMTTEILELMEERRQHKARDENKYREIHRNIRKKIREAKESWLSERCKEIEDLDKKYDSFHVHKKIREMTGIGNNRTSNILKDDQGNVISEVKEKLSQWTNYIRQLFNDDRGELLLQKTEDTGPPILRQEVIYAIKNTKNGKAVGPDEVPIELIRLIDEDCIDVLVELFNEIYQTGTIPKQWLQSTFVAIPKKPHATTCSDHRTIALMSHTLKVFLKIIHSRIVKTLENEISDTQFGFRNGMSTREALFGLNVLAQRCLDMNHDIYLCFVDFEKAFDKVQHGKLIEILNSKNIDSRNIEIISRLYWNQTAKVKVDNQFTENIEIQRGVRQGCVLSPLLFNVYSEAIFQNTLSDSKEGISINGEILNNLRFADDTVIMTDNMNDLQNVMQRLNTNCNEYGLRINLNKTKYMVITKSIIENTQLNVENTDIERVNAYKYLGAWITSSIDQTKEIKTRIEVARTSFIKLKKFLCCRDIGLKLRLRMLRCYVFPTLLYGLEAWTLKQAQLDKLAAFELWCYRRILRISWTERVSNIEVTRRVENEPEILITIKKRKLEYLGHVMRGQKYALLQLIIQGRIRGKRSVGRRRLSWLRNLREWFGCSSAELFRAAVNKVRIAMIVSNLR